MAAPACSYDAPLRLRLLFDYPPPVTPGCGLCWLLVEPNQVRFVTDLIVLIRDKFGFSRRAKLSLFLDGALLLPTESVRVVRDNDSLRVRLEEVIGGDSYDTVTNGFSNLSKKQRKRQWQKLEAKDSESKDEEHKKRKKEKWNFEHQEESTIQDPMTRGKKKKVMTKRAHVMDSESNDSSHSKKLRKKTDQEKKQDATGEKRKKKARTFLSKSPLQETKKSPNLCQKTTEENRIVKTNAKKGDSSSESSTSSSDSGDSIPDTKQKLTSKRTSQYVNKPQLVSSLKSVSAGNQKDKISLETGESKKSKSQSSSSDSDSSSGKEEAQQTSNRRNKLSCKDQGKMTGQSSKTKLKSSSSDSSSSKSETCTVKKQKETVTINQTSGGNTSKQLSACGIAPNSSENRRGRGRGESPFWRGPRVRGCRGMNRSWRRGESTHFFYNYGSDHYKQQQLNESAANTSVVIQNPVKAPGKDYSTLPLLAAPPQAGEKIAFKVLELTENYTPEVSDYKEGKIVSWNPANKQLELEILSFSSVAKEPGKFDLVYQSADGAETIEYAVSQDRKITESWDALIEPRLIIDPPNNEPGAKKDTLSDVTLPEPQM